MGWSHKRGTTIVQCHIGHCPAVDQPQAVPLVQKIKELLIFRQTETLSLTQGHQVMTEQVRGASICGRCSAVGAYVNTANGNILVLCIRTTKLTPARVTLWPVYQIHQSVAGCFLPVDNSNVLWAWTLLKTKPRNPTGNTPGGLK